MNNNDTVIRIRYVFDLKDKDVQKIFELGELSFSLEEVRKILTKSKDDSYFHDDVELETIDTMEVNIPCTNEMLERFLNGFIIYKRGPQRTKPGATASAPLTIESDKSVNNVMLKKLKIALGLTGDDVIAIFKSVDVSISKSELGGLLRKEGHKHYRYCGDNYARKFLKALTLKYRNGK